MVVCDICKNKLDKDDQTKVMTKFVVHHQCKQELINRLEDSQPIFGPGSKTTQTTPKEESPLTQGDIQYRKDSQAEIQQEQGKSMSELLLEAKIKGVEVQVSQDQCNHRGPRTLQEGTNGVIVQLCGICKKTMSKKRGRKK